MPTGTVISWEAFSTAGAEGERWEWADGGVEFMSPANMQQEAFLMLLADVLVRYCQGHPEWIAFGSNTVFTMASGNWRQPDASLVKRSNFSGGPFPVRAGFPPDVAFEILSPGDSPSHLQSKRLDYQQSGVIQVWFELEKRVVELIYPDRAVRHYRQDEVLTVPSLPGFSLPLKELLVEPAGS
jgi:Uma2 family endonuclease